MTSPEIWLVRAFSDAFPPARIAALAPTLRSPMTLTDKLPPDANVPVPVRSSEWVKNDPSRV